MTKLEKLIKLYARVWRVDYDEAVKIIREALDYALMELKKYNE